MSRHRHRRGVRAVHLQPRLLTRWLLLGDNVMGLDSRSAAGPFLSISLCGGHNVDRYVPADGCQCLHIFLTCEALRCLSNSLNGVSFKAGYDRCGALR